MSGDRIQVKPEDNLKNEARNRYEKAYHSDFHPRSTLSEGQSESRVLIILTGGTICMDPSPAGLTPSGNFLETHLRVRPTFNCSSSAPLGKLISYEEDDRSRANPIVTNALRTPASKLGRHVLYTVHELYPLLDSSSISAPAWTRISRLIQRNYLDYDGFVVLHGTDSLAYTASALSFMFLNLQKPVILTGSQVPMSALHSDATDNLIGALAIAGHFRIPEVGLFFHQRLLRGCRATKVSADAFAAFDSPSFGPLAEIKAMGIRVHWDRVWDKVLPTSNIVFNDHVKLQPLRIRAHMGTAFVACLRLFPGITAEMLDAVIRVKSLKGLVLETFGAGNAPLGVGVPSGEEQSSSDNDLMRVLTEAKSRQVVVVGVSQCLTGSVLPVYAAGVTLQRAGVIAGADMTTEAALTKLAYLFEGGRGEGGIEGPDGVETPRIELDHKGWAVRTEHIREGMRYNMRGEMGGEGIEDEPVPGRRRDGGNYKL